MPATAAKAATFSSRERLDRSSQKAMVAWCTAARGMPSMTKGRVAIAPAAEPTSRNRSMMGSW